MIDWTLDPKSAQQIDDRMQAGYRLSTSPKLDRVKAWAGLWEYIKEVIDEQGIPSLEDLDEALDGTQSIYNWAMDFEVELHNTAINDHAYNELRITFCEEYIARSFDKLDPNVLEMQRGIADAYFNMGNYEEAERLFSSFVYRNPTDGWGWIYWADQYGLRAKKDAKDYEKATHILLNALEIEDLSDRHDVMDRLADVYHERGMRQEEFEIRQVLEKELRSKLMDIPSFPKEFLASMDGFTPTKQVPITSIKIGRNDPCTCGSGKKFKKRCG